METALDPTTAENNPNFGSAMGQTPLITTSAPSRAAYATNVTNMNGAIANITGPSSPTLTQLNNRNAATGNPLTPTGTYSGTEATDQKGGLLPGGSPANAGKTGYDVYGNPVSGNNGVDTARQNGGTYTGMDNKAYYSYDGSSVPDNADSSKVSDGSNEELLTNSSLDPATLGAYKDALGNLDSNIASAKDTLTQALSTLQNDPLATSAVNSIIQKYDQQIELMKNKNAMVLGGYQVNAARSGGLQYANDMTDSFLSLEQDKASGRIADLVSQETQLVLKAQAAYKSGDLKAFNAAQTAYEKANQDKIDEINKLLKATNDQVKSLQTEQKAKSQASKDSLASDIKNSTNMAGSIAKNLSDAGVTDPQKVSDYIESAAKEYGISNPEILRSAVIKAQQANEKGALGIANSAATLDKKVNGTTTTSKKATGGGKDGAFTYTADDIATYTNLLNKGGKDPQGNVFAPRGADSYVDPGTYVAAYTDWIAQGGTPKGFVKNFPVTNVNPASYKLLPAGLQPKAAAATAQFKV